MRVSRAAMLFSLRSLLIAGATLIPAANASALVVEGLQSMPRPVGGWVGNFNGATGVCVGPDWVISAKHVGGGVGSWFILQGNAFQVVETRPHPELDLTLFRVDRPLPGFHKIARTATLGDPVILGGHGLTGANALTNGDGYDWGGPRQEMWGANVIEMEGFLWGVRFDRPSSTEAVPSEAIFALSDSGGGLFIVGPEGDLQLAGMAVSVSGYGSARYGNMGFCINLIVFRNWILPIVDPNTPIDSGIRSPTSLNMPRGGDLFKQATPALALAGLSLPLIVRRRRN